MIFWCNLSVGSQGLDFSSSKLVNVVISVSLLAMMNSSFASICIPLLDGFTYDVARDNICYIQETQALMTLCSL